MTFRLDTPADVLDAVSLRPAYASFLAPRPEAPRRILLTGHSHQAWPDVARAAQLEAFDVAADRVDDKWGAVFACQRDLAAHVARRIGGAADEIAFAANTHELVTRWLSALPLALRPHLVATSGEFHSADRQLRRLAEEGVRVTFVDVEPASTLAERLAAAVDDGTAGVVVSTVLFETSTIVHGLAELVEHARARGAEVLLDAYHAFDVVPFRVPPAAFLVAGGYKYAQWGEGACFLRVPAGCALRPVYTGWFAGFAELAHGRRAHGAVPYAADGATRFAGSTFDPTSAFRARAVARFFEERGMTVAALRATSLAKTARILDAARALEDRDVSLATPRSPEDCGGFVALRTPRARELADALRAEGIWTDARGDLLRLGPAPYVTDAEIDEAMSVLASLVAR